MASGMLPRRQLLEGSLALAGLGLLAGCGVSKAPLQPEKKLPRLAFLSFRPLGGTPEVKALLEELRELGQVMGETIRLDFYSGPPEVLAPDLAQLIESRVDVIVAVSNLFAQAARAATDTIPIVMVASSDPVKAGLIASLARPGGNVTGVTTLVPELASKRLELLKELVPHARRVGILWHADYVEGATLDELREPAQKLGLQLIPLVLNLMSFRRDLAAVGEAAASGQIEAMMVAYQPVPSSQSDILNLVRQHRLPTIFPSRELAVNGGLLAFGADQQALYRRVAALVDRILRGARPADLPVEQPTKFDTVLNRQTAELLGLWPPPQTVQLQLTEVIQ